MQPRLFVVGDGGWGRTHKFEVHLLDRFIFDHNLQARGSWMTQYTLFAVRDILPRVCCPLILAVAGRVFSGAPAIFARTCRQLLSGATTEQVQKGLDDLFAPFHEVGAVKI